MLARATCSIAAFAGHALQQGEKSDDPNHCQARHMHGALRPSNAREWAVDAFRADGLDPLVARKPVVPGQSDPTLEVLPHNFGGHRR